MSCDRGWYFLRWAARKIRCKKNCPDRVVLQGRWNRGKSAACSVAEHRRQHRRSFLVKLNDVQGCIGVTCPLSGYLFLYFFFVSLFLCVILVSVFLIFPVCFTVSLSLFPPMCSATWSVSEPNELRQPCEAPLRRHGPGPCWQCRCSRPSRALPSGQLGRHCSTRANRQPQRWIAC